VGVASDNYALAVVVYEWLVGERPFTGSFVELASQHLLTPPPGLRQKNSGILPVVERVVLAALAKKQAQRFGSVKDFAQALVHCGFEIPMREEEEKRRRRVLPKRATRVILGEKEQ
jgi:hypothetical protein